MYQPDTPDPNAGVNRETRPDANPGPDEVKDANREPLPGAPVAHPVGTGVGAVGGGTAGAAIGAAAGPVGAVVGAAVGGVVGGLIGKGVAESVNPTVEHGYWQAHFGDRPYVEPGAKYEAYGPAYQFGWENWSRYPDREFSEVEPELRQDWETSGRSTSLAWDRAREAARDAWNRVKGGAGPRHDTGY